MLTSHRKKELKDFISKLINSKDYLWLRSALKNELRYADYVDLKKDEINSDSILVEQCVLEIAREQAKDYYSSLPEEYDALKDDLINDYVDMEMGRRHNKLNIFTLHLFKQVENLVNASLNEEVFNFYESTFYTIENWDGPDKHRYDLLFTKHNSRYNTYEGNKKKYENYKSRKDDIIKWDISFKLKLITLYKLQTGIKNKNRNDYWARGEYYNITKGFNELKKLRNGFAHGDSVGANKTKYQEEDFEKLMVEGAQLYFRSLGFYQQFYRTVCLC